MADTRGSNLIRYLGLMGNNTGRTGSLVPRAQTPDADQRLWQEFVDAGRIGDPEIWTKFNTMMRRPTTFDAMLQMWDEMSQWDLLAAALVEIVDEATQVDSNSPGVLWYQCNDPAFEEELNDMLVKVEAESVLPSQVWYVAGLGNAFEKLEYAPTEGVLGMSFVHPMEMRRYWLERNRKCIGFRWMNHKPNKEDVFVQPDNRTPVERVSMAAGQSVEDLWYPWDFLHFRRMFRMRMSEHGEPIFAEADGIYKKLRLAIDQMVVCRAQVQPDRYAVSVDVQEQSPAEQMKTVQRWRQALRSKLAFGQVGSPSDLNSASDFASYYNALSLDTILYIAQPKGFNHTITKLNGTADVPDVYDIELLTDLFYSIIGMPKSWFSGGQASGGGEMPSGRALLAQDIRFLRKIKSIRKPIINTYQWLGYFHAVLKGKDVRNLDIKVKMPEIGSLEEQLKMEMLGIQADILQKLGDVMEQYSLPKEAWIETVFKRYMHLPDDVVSVFLTALPSEIEQSSEKEESRIRKAAPSTLKLINEISEKISKTPGASDAIKMLREVVYKEKLLDRPHRKWTNEQVYTRPRLKENDIVVSSYGRHPFEFKRAGVTSESTKTGVLQARLTENKKDTSWENDNAPVPAAPPNGEAPASHESPYRRWIG